MNKVFCRIWNRALGAYVVASELADRRVRDGRRVRAAVLAIVCMPAIASAAAQERTIGSSAADPEKITELVERHLNENERVLAGGALPLWSTAAMGQSRAVAGGVAPMGVIDPGGLTGGTLPGLVQHLTNFLLPVSNQYRACGLLGNGTLLPDECLSIARENFSYAFQSVSLLGTDLLTIPDVLDLNGNRPADHTTIIGRASSGSYISVPIGNYAGQNNDPSCELVVGIGVCVPGVLGTYTWDTLPAQDYQIIVGDGAAANGSNTVVMGTNASHVLPAVSATDLGWTGGPDGNYAARLGNAVVIGHNASGTADRQTILGANASSVHANSVALGADSVTIRGAQAGYVAPGLQALQTSAGEVSIGNGTAARQLTNVAAGSAATDAVNLAQLQGALADVDSVGAFAVRYDDDGAGAPNFGRITLAGAGGTTIGNVAPGVAADEAVNVGQLSPVVAALGGNAAIDPTTGAVTGPVYTLDDGSDTGTTANFGDVGSALANLDGRTASNTTTINNLLDGTEGLVRQDPGTLVMTVGGQTGGDEVSFANAGGDARRLSGVAAGVEATDAVNVTQLTDVADAVDDLGALAVQYDADVDGNPDYSRVTLAGTGGTALGNVAAGEVSAASSEAINGAQLFGVAGSVADHLGGGAGVNADGTISAPTYVIRGGNYTNVGDAFDAVDGAFDDLVDDVGDLGATAVRYDTDVDGNPDYSRVTLAGAGGTAIGNVAAGVAADEAVNVGQLTPVVAALGGNAAIDPTTGAVTGPVYTLDDGNDTGTTTDFGDVGSALANLDGRTASNTTTINNLLDGTEGLVRQDPGTLVMTVGGQTGGDEVSFANAGGDARRLSGVAAGVEATDAVNVSQLSDVVGDIDDLGASAVRYDTDADGNPDYSRVTLAGTGGTAIGNVAAGEVSATSSEAINGAQLFGVAGSVADHLGGGAGVNADGTISAPTYVIRGGNYTNVGDAFDAVDGAFDDLVVDVGDLGATAVRYDTDADGNPDYSRVTLAGAGGTAIGNVAAGVAADEAVNVGQLSPVVTALGGGAAIDPTTGAVTGPVYTLDDGSDTGTTADFGDVGSALDNLDGRTASNTTTINNLLDGTEGLVRQDPGTLVMTVGAQTGGDQVSFVNVAGDARRLSGVAAGIEATDAVNVGQLSDVVGDIDDLGAAAVRYDTDADGNPDYSRVTLAGTGGTAIGNVAAGEVSATSSEAINGAQLFGVAGSVADHLGGGAGVNADGTISAPTYVIRGGNYTNVGDAFDAVDGAFDDLVVDVGDLGATAVRYDTDADGNPDYSRVTLAGAGGTAIGNVAAGVAVDDAVNVGQLTPVVAALGGGAAIDPTTGAVTGPVYTLDDGNDTGTTADFGDVGSALDNLDGRTASNTTTINNLLDGTEGLVRQDPGTLVMTVGGQTGGDEVSFANVDGDARRLSGVDDGIDDTDAANVRQLRAVEGQIGDLDAFAVRYDTADMARITLGGSGGTVIDNLAAGQIAAGSLQAINGGQMFASMSSMAAIFGGGAAVDPFGGLVPPDYLIQGTFYNSVGDALAALDTGLSQVNTRIDNLPPGSGGDGRDPLVAVDGPRDGTDDATVVDGQRGVAIGANATKGGRYGMAVGGDSYAAGDHDTAIGGNAKVHADNSTAVGANTTVLAAASEAVAVGEGATVAAIGGTAIGQGATVTDTAQGAVALGQGSVADRAGTVSVGSAGSERQVVNVAAGTQDTDAVNVAQLRASEQGTVRYDTNPDGSANPTQITLNQGGGEVMVRNVRAGAAGTDAVNVNQLNAGIGRAIGEANAYTDMRVGQMQSDIWEIDRGYRAGVAAAMAVAGLPQAYMPGKSMVSAAVSGYEREAGLAVGITTVSENGRWVYKFSGTTNTVNDVGFTMGAGLQW